MFLAKNLLIGLGSVGVVGGGGYLIYNATRSGDENFKTTEDNKETEKGDSSGVGQTQNQSSQTDKQQEQQSDNGTPENQK